MLATALELPAYRWPLPGTITAPPAGYRHRFPRGSRAISSISRTKGVSDSRHG